MHAYRDQYAQLFRNGRDVVLIAISSDSPEALASWAKDDEFPFLFGSDGEANIGRLYGAARSRTLFVIDPQGEIAFVAAPFREIDPMAYEELQAAIDAVAPTPSSEGGF